MLVSTCRETLGESKSGNWKRFPNLADSKHATGENLHHGLSHLFDFGNSSYGVFNVATKLAVLCLCFADGLFKLLQPLGVIFEISVMFLQSLALEAGSLARSMSA